MQTIKLRFDGRVFVPESPVNLPVGYIAEIPLDLPNESTVQESLAELRKIAQEFPDNPAWPADGAAQVDHYLYGLPKQP
jgi:hypothetical protein